MTKAQGFYGAAKAASLQNGALQCFSPAYESRALIQTDDPTLKGLDYSHDVSHA